MKIGGYPSVQKVRPTERRHPASRTAPADESPSSGIGEILDTTELFGVPEAELTPKVRQAFLNLMAEVETLRQELHASQRRVGELEKLADQDPLAPVANRRAFVRDMSRMMSYADRYGVPSSLVFFDVNGLKEINDRHGHAAGDRALLNVAQALLENTRESDVVGRLGGDEFGVILAQADDGVAATKAEELAHSIRQRPVVIDGATVQVDVAFGVFPFGTEGDASDALAEADRRMYEKKRRMKADAA